MQDRTSKKSDPELRRKAALRRGDKYYHHGCGEIRATLTIVKKGKRNEIPYIHNL